jgi:hypothetical protein
MGLREVRNRFVGGVCATGTVILGLPYAAGETVGGLIEGKSLKDAAEGGFGELESLA